MVDTAFGRGAGIETTTNQCKRLLSSKKKSKYRSRHIRITTSETQDKRDSGKKDSPTVPTSNRATGTGPKGCRGIVAHQDPRFKVCWEGAEVHVEQGYRRVTSQAATCAREIVGQPQFAARIILLC